MASFVPAVTFALKKASILIAFRRNYDVGKGSFVEDSCYRHDFFFWLCSVFVFSFGSVLFFSFSNEGFVMYSCDASKQMVQILIFNLLEAYSVDCIYCCNLLWEELNEHNLLFLLSGFRLLARTFSIVYFFSLMFLSDFFYSCFGLRAGIVCFIKVLHWYGTQKYVIY